MVGLSFTVTITEGDAAASHPVVASVTYNVNVLVVEGDARAYPLRIIDNHEMANDIVGGIPVSLAYCTLCGAAIAYEGLGPDGQSFTFGTSGKLICPV